MLVFLTGLVALVIIVGVFAFAIFSAMYLWDTRASTNWHLRVDQASRLIFGGVMILVVLAAAALAAYRLGEGIWRTFGW